MKQAFGGPADVAPSQVRTRKAVRGRTTVAAILPSGRVVWLRVKPALASAAAADDLRHRVERLADRRDVIMGRQSAELERLTRTISADTQRLSQTGLASARKLRRHLTAGAEQLGRRALAETEAQRTTLERQMAQQRQFASRLGRRDLWDKIVVATSAPLFAAYGQRRSPFATNNLALALSLGIWLAGDEVAQAITGSGDRVPDALRDPDVWSYVAPIGNVLTGWWLMHNRQHQRFIAGSEELLPAPALAGPPRLGTATERLLRFTSRIDLTPQIAVDYLDDFQSFIDVAAVASVSRLQLTPAGTAAGATLRRVTAEVDGTNLHLAATIAVPSGQSAASRLSPVVDRLEVAWIVDTKEPAEPTFTS